jgi:glycosyltransferase involved in cell wall biosynthesis
MRVTLLSLGYPPYTFGGVETYVRLLSLELSRNGINTNVIAGWPNRNASLEEVNNNLKILRLPIIDFPIRYIWFQFLNSSVILNLLKHSDLVHSNSRQTSLLNSRIRRIKPLIITVHNSAEEILAYLRVPSLGLLSPGDLFFLSEYPLIKRFYLADLQHSDRLICVAEHVRRESMMDAHENRSEVACKSDIVFPGVDLSQFGPWNPKNVKNDNLEMAFVGRLFYPKGITYVMRTLNSLVNEMGEKSVRLHIFGVGPLNSWMKSYARRKKLQSNIVVHGQIQRSKLLEHLKQIHVAILPSLYEGCPYFIMEANALGIPVISFDFPWSREFISDGLNGYRSPPFDYYRLAENALKAARLNRQRITVQASKYDVRMTVRKTIEIYQKLLEKRK